MKRLHDKKRSPANVPGNLRVRPKISGGWRTGPATVARMMFWSWYTNSRCIRSNWRCRTRTSPGSGNITETGNRYADLYDSHRWDMSPWTARAHRRSHLTGAKLLGHPGTYCFRSLSSCLSPPKDARPSMPTSSTSPPAAPPSLGTEIIPNKAPRRGIPESLAMIEAGEKLSSIASPSPTYPSPKS